MRFLLPLSLALATAAQAAAPFPVPVQTLSHPEARAVSYVDRQRTLATNSENGVLLVPRTGTPRSLKVPGKLWAGLVTPQGRMLAAQLNFEACQVAVWDVTAGRKVTALRGDFTRVFGCDQPEGGEFIFDVAFTPDGRFVLTADQTGVRRWDARTGKLLRALPGKFFNLNISADGRSVVTVGEGRRVEVWASDLSRRLKSLPQQPSDCLRGPGPWPTGTVWSADSTKLAFSCDREVRVWNVAAGGLQSLRREGKIEYPDAPIFSPDGRFVAADEDSAGVAVWQTGNGQRVTQIRLAAPQLQITDVAIAPNNVLYAAQTDGQVVRVDMKRVGTPLTPWTAFAIQTGTAQMWPSLAVSREGDRLAVASGDGRLNVYALPGN